VRVRAVFVQSATCIWIAPQSRRTDTTGSRCGGGQVCIEVLVRSDLGGRWNPCLMSYGRLSAQGSQGFECGLEVGWCGRFETYALTGSGVLDAEALGVQGLTFEAFKRGAHLGGELP